MKALLGCEHCGKVMRRLGDEDLETCPSCGRLLREVGLVEAHALQRERRIAEQFRRTAGIHRPIVRAAPLLDEAARTVTADLPQVGEE